MIEHRLGGEFVVPQWEDPMIVMKDVLDNERFAGFPMLPYMGREISRDR